MNGVNLSLACLRATATVLGAAGVFCLWASFYVHAVGLQAVLCIAMATALTLLTPLE